jgi:hypothetical protein
MFSVGLLMAVLGASALVIGSAKAQPFAPGLEDTPTPIPDCGLNWRPITSPNSGTNSNQLRGVAVVSANDVWAVGDYAGGSAFQTLTMHYTNGQWSVVPSPNLGTSGNHLTGVAAVSANDIWAVGYYYDNSSNTEQTLTMHYADGQWTVVPSPNVGTSMNNLTGVAAVSANDVWAVGDYVDGSAFQTLTMHYTNGQWTVVTSPNISTSGNFLTAVAAVSANDVWAVGHYYDDDNKTEKTLTMRYTNGQWTVVTSPNSGTTNNYLAGVAAAATNDVWAVGYYGPIGGPYQTLTMHYTNGQWNVVPSANVDTGSNALSGVAAVSANDVWAVGYYFNTSSNTEQTLTMHYTNGQWMVISTPNVGTSQNYLSAVAAVSANDVWAVGRYLNLTPTPAYQTLTMHYSDPCVTATPTATATPGVQATSTSTSTPPTLDMRAQWYVPPSPCNNYSFVLSIHVEPFGATVPVTTTMAFNGVEFVVPPFTGYYAIECSTGPCTPGHIYYGLVADFHNDVQETDEGNNVDYHMHLFGSPCTPTAMTTPTSTRTTTALPSQTPNGPSATAVPSSTPIVCTLQFTDLPADSSFYYYVRCLACQGIVSGYACGAEGEPCDSEYNPYFRPNANVTRGQIAKIVSNSAGYDEDPGGQIYEDVPASNTFYVWINRLTMRGHMGGYECGGEGEPCGVEERPYFRPYVSATRAQLAKIVSNAAGLVDLGTEQIFTDVPPDNGFYVWIQRLASRGIMGGYTCGGAGEPCDDQDRPYFRPYNSVTRGQTSKIVAGTFFPDCQVP